MPKYINLMDVIIVANDNEVENDNVSDWSICTRTEMELYDRAQMTCLVCSFRNC